MAIRVSQPAISAVAIGPPVPMNWQVMAPVASILVSFTNTPVGTYSVEYTLDNIQDKNPDGTPVFGTNGVNAVWQPMSTMTAKTATADAKLDFPVAAIRLNVTAWTTGNVVLKVLQGDDR